eukprot:gene7307-9954_t
MFVNCTFQRLLFLLCNYYCIISSKPLQRIGIVGCGPSGLSFAASIKQLQRSQNQFVENHNFIYSIDIFDSRIDPLSTRLGGGVQLSSGAVILNKIGLFEDLRKVSLPIQTLNSYQNNGNKIFTINITDLIISEKRTQLYEIIKDSDVKYPLIVSIMRDALQSLLYNATQDNKPHRSFNPIKNFNIFGLNKDSVYSNLAINLQMNSSAVVSLQNNKKLKTIIEHEENDTLSLYFEDGTCENNYDIIIGADGVNSKVKEFMEYGTETILPSPVNDFIQNIINNNNNQSDRDTGIRISYCVTPPLRDGESFANGSFNQWLGDGCYALTASYNGLRGIHDMLAVVYKDSNYRNNGENADWNADQIKEIVYKRLLDAGLSNRPELTSILAAASREGGRFFDLGVKDRTIPLKTWSSKSGKIILIGDSAHAMAPFLGQGANQAIQDGYCLASLIINYNKNQIESSQESSSIKINIANKFEQIRKFQIVPLGLKALILGFIETLGGVLGTKFKFTFFRFVGSVGIVNKEYIDATIPKV